MKKPYDGQYSPSNGITVSKMVYEICGLNIALELWELPGNQVDCKEMYSVLLQGADGVFIVFNVNRLESIYSVDIARKHCSSFISGVEIPFILLAHKADLVEERVMSSDDVDAYRMVSLTKSFECRIYANDRVLVIDVGFGQLEGLHWENGARIRIL